LVAAVAVLTLSAKVAMGGKGLSELFGQEIRDLSHRQPFG
jgi:hypothetical protein